MNLLEPRPKLKKLWFEKLLIEKSVVFFCCVLRFAFFSKLRFFLPTFFLFLKRNQMVDFFPATIDVVSST